MKKAVLVPVGGMWARKRILKISIGFVFTFFAYAERLFRAKGAEMW